MKRCRDCEFVDMYTEYDPFTDDLCRVWCMKKNRDVDRYKMIDRCTFWVAKVIILLALLLGGCSQKIYHRQAFDLQGNVTESVKITLTDCIMHSEAEQIYVEFDGKKRKLIIGKFSQWPDAETVRVIAVGFRPWWIGMWGLSKER